MVLRSYSNFLDLTSGDGRGGGEPLLPLARLRVPRVVTASGIVPDLDASSDDTDAASAASDHSSSNAPRERVINVANQLPVCAARRPDGGWDFAWDEDSLLLQVRDSVRLQIRDSLRRVVADDVLPVDHDLLERFRCVPTFLPLLPELWHAYASVNKIFADKILEVISPDEDFVKGAKADMDKFHVVKHGPDVLNPCTQMPGRFFGHNIPSPDHGRIIGFVMVPGHVFQLVKNPDAALLLRRTQATSQATASVCDMCNPNAISVLHDTAGLYYDIVSPTSDLFVDLLYTLHIHIKRISLSRSFPTAQGILMDHEYSFHTHRDLVDHINTRTKGVVTDGPFSWAIVTVQDFDVCIPKERIFNSREPHTLFRSGSQAARQVLSCFTNHWGRLDQLFRVYSGVHYCLPSKERLFGATIATTSASSSSTSTSVGAQSSNGPPEWLLDSGSSFCVTGDLTMLQDPHYPGVVSATAANGQTMWSTICGRAAGTVSLSGIRYFPGATMNLISQGFLVRFGCRCEADLQGLRIWKGDVLVGKGRLLPNDLWSVDCLDERHLGDPACPGCWSSHQAH